jgi:hypothetical protein
VEGCSPDFPALLVELRLLIVLLVVLGRLLLFHGLTSVAHHALDVEGEQCTHEGVEGVVPGLHEFPEFSAEGFDEVGECGEGCVEDIADELDAVDLLPLPVPLDDAYQQQSCIPHPEAQLHVVSANYLI